jgi:hypothetical protein
VISGLIVFINFPEIIVSFMLYILPFRGLP